MRQLTDKELQEIRNTILQKEISSAEILMEVYDHYVSHLQEFPIEEFNDQLFELEEKFTYAYCHALQAKFNKEIKKELSSLHWQVFKRYFCLSKILYVLIFSFLAFQMSRYVTDEKEIAIIVLSPLLILAGAHIFFLMKSHFRIKAIKKDFNTEGPLQSSLYYPFSEKLYLPVVMAYVIMWSVESVFNSNDIANLAPSIAAIIFIILSIYVLTLLEVWQIKTKTALI
ncbi:hypothetical protein SAMN00777080_2405 [Aquiflexum balticum DSM 16537]|uniref:Uncharacterized protein n=1 Tax=Aquiflexum balticum DSM 16537 TaxID=758820 RepID=A0A1W2H5N9_9BACT|nr:hypothetical protein [Aquiflexum balticum]SMD43796.1 hypothetical protein SAMN00777080_2405 [Aquiflexum balticum DSM 16537]